jgi:hypothetical protein
MRHFIRSWDSITHNVGGIVSWGLDADNLSTD